MGAGTGYWAALLRSRGVDIVAYDVAPPSYDEAAAPDDDAPDHLKCPISQMLLRDLVAPDAPPDPGRHPSGRQARGHG